MIADDDQDMMAAEYALGTLDAQERAEVEALIAEDAAFAAVVQGWERRIGELHQLVEPVEPPDAVWEAIRDKLGIAPAPIVVPPVAESEATPEEPAFLRNLRSDTGHSVAADAEGTENAEDADVVDLTRRLRRWRFATAGVSAIAATLLLVAGLRDYAPQYLPDAFRRPVTAAAGEFVAVLQRDAASPGFILTIDMATRNFTVRKVGADKPADRSYELWLIHDRFPGPRSLGVVGDDTFSRAAASGYDRDTINQATYAVTLEPVGGSPSGNPTGPVVFSGKLIEAAPPGVPGGRR